VSDEKPEALLKSALEKILYFEARSSQLTNDADTSRSELERFKADLAAASQREIELRRVVAELEVRVTRAHSEREETARLADALRRERADLVGKMLEASRIHGLDQGLDDFDLGQFIAQLRSEVLVQRGDAVLVGPAPTTSGTVTGVANELKAQGRLSVSPNEFATLTGAREFPGRSEETLFGFSVRELSAPDASARVRAAERLQALRHPAATPALATALHGETEPPVQVALLAALASLAKVEALPVVMPLLSSSAPEVRIAALKAMITLDKAVRRRASLLALGLSGKEALELGTQAIRDGDADVRALAALVLGASNAEVARPLLMEAMRDVDVRVRRAASQSLSRLLGQDVTSLVSLDDAHRRREVRRLASVPSKLVTGVSAASAASASSVASVSLSFSHARERVGANQFPPPQQRVAAPVLAARVVTPAPVAPRAAAPVVAPMAATPGKARVAVLEVEEPLPEELLTAAMRELRASIRGRQLPELASGIGVSTEQTLKVCGELMAQGQVVRRGLKYFVA
jgi:HEAT repeat protein